MKALDDALHMLYGRGPGVPDAQRARYRALKARFLQLFPEQTSVRFFSAPGRTEIGGNHTDHQSGRVLAAAVNLDTVAAVARNGERKARIYSEGFKPLEVDLSDLSV
ncbi:MAG: galactokinase family protein, partial [Christensenellales bacterium]|nr:galactokinase family protein [Christensenellales bacterium]